MVVSARALLLLLALVWLLAPKPVVAKPAFGNAVDTFCTHKGRTPATPYAGECAICHNANDDGRDRTAGFSEYRSHRGDGDFSYFCPADVPNEPPVLDPIGNQNVNEGGLLSLRITARDPEGGALLLVAADLPTGAAFQDNGNGKGDFLWMPDSGQSGNHSVLFRVSDMGEPPAIDDERITISVGEVNRPPVLDAIGNQMLPAGDRLVLPLRATDPDGNLLRFGAAGLPEGATLLDLGNGNAELRWQTEGADLGSHLVTLTVSDDGDPVQSDSEVVFITVGSSNHPPQLSPVGNRRLDPGKLVMLMFTASDVDADALSLVLVGAPEGAIFDDAGNGSATLRWLPDAGDLGNHEVTLTVLDDGIPVASDQETFILTVGGVNRPPEIEPIGVVSEGEFLIVPLMAQDPDGDHLTWSGVIPVGATLDDHGDGSAEFRWRPSAKQRGRFPVRFTAKDDGEPLEQSTVGTTLSVGGSASNPGVDAGAPDGGPSKNSGLRCGAGFELVFLLLPWWWLRGRGAQRFSQR